MVDHVKTKEELLAELALLRQRVTELERLVEPPACAPARKSLLDASYRHIIDQSPVGVEIYSPDGTLIYINQATEQLWGVAAVDMLGFNILQDQQLKARGVMPLVERAFRGEAIVTPPVMFDPQLSNHKGRKRWVESFLYPIIDEDGRIGHVVMLQTDVTERKISEDALRHAHGELEECVAERTRELSRANEILLAQLAELKRADEQREILQLILENIPLMIDYYDEQGNILLINPAWQRFFGWSMEDLKTRGSQAFIESIIPNPQTRQRLLEYMMKAEPGWHDLKVKLPDGRVSETSWLINRLSNGNTIGIGQDVSDQRSAEDQLQKSEASLRAIVEGVTDCIYMKDMSGLYRMINSAGVEAMNMPLEEIIGKDDASIFPPDAARHIMDNDQKVITTGEMMTFEDNISMAGYQRTYLTTKVPYRDKQGNVAGVIGISRDITERKRAEEALAEEKERLAVTLRSIGDGVITTDITGRVVLMNRVAEVMTGITQEEAIGRQLAQVFHMVSEKTRKVCRNPVERVLKTGSTVDRANHVVLIARDGTERIISDSAAPIRDRESKIIGVVLVFRDITEKRKIEEKLLREQAARAAARMAEAQLEKTNTQLQALSAHVLKAQEEERIRLARELHDELGQALTSIKLALEFTLTSMPTITPERLNRVLTDLCNYVETTAKDVQRVARDLRPSVLDDFGLAAALESYSDAYSKRTGIKVMMSLDRLSRILPKEVEGALYRIVQEALTNAAKHSGARNISIDLTEQGSEMILTILDDGHGCSDAALSEYQKNGFGLMGMAERARIIGAHLSIKSEKGDGFCLQVSLPYRKNGL